MIYVPISYYVVAFISAIQKKKIEVNVDVEGGLCNKYQLGTPRAETPAWASRLATLLNLAFSVSFQASLRDWSDSSLDVEQLVPSAAKVHLPYLAPGCFRCCGRQPISRISAAILI